MTALADLPLLASGKVREIYDLGDTLLIVASDRISTYDVVHPTPIPDKGSGAHGPVHVLVRAHRRHRRRTTCISVTDGVPDEARGRGMVVRKLEMLPVECVVRGYITGSGWKDYQRDRRGLRDRAARRACASPTSCPSRSSRPPRRPTSATTRRSTSRAPSSWSATARWPSACATSRSRSTSTPPTTPARTGSSSPTRSSSSASTTTATLTLGDEVCTPDSSRFWPADEYEPGRGQPSFDKQFVRDWASSTGWDRTPPAPADPRRRRRAHPREVRRGVRAHHRRAVRGLAAPNAGPDESPGAGQAKARDSRSAGPGSAASAAGARLHAASRNVHVGRLIELDVEDPSQLPEMCERLLANPLIEDYEIVRGPIAEPARGPREVRRDPLPRLVRRDRRAARRGARRRGGDAVARRPRPPGRRRGDRPRRLLLRRLPARRSDRAVRAGDGRGRRVRARGRPRARHLQRLSGPVRGAPAPGRAAAQRLAEVRLPPGRARGRRRRHRVHRRLRAQGDRLSIPVKHTTGRFYASDDELDRLEASGQVVLRYAPGHNPNGSRRDIAGVRNERGQRVRADATPRARGRSADRFDGRPEDLRVDASACRRRASSAKRPSTASSGSPTTSTS